MWMREEHRGARRRVDRSRAADGADGLQLDVTRTDTGTQIFSQMYALTSQSSLPASLDLHGARSSPTISIRAQLLLGSQVLVERRATLPFEPDRAIELRLPLDRSCVDFRCTEENTCVNGACVPVELDPTTLPPIASDPLAPVDMGAGVVDLAASTDLATLVDLAAPPDLASTDLAMCPSVPLPSYPVETVGNPACKRYDFTTAFPARLTFTPDANVTAAIHCGALEIATPPGTHASTVSFDDYDALKPLSTSFRLYASFDVVQSMGSWAGVQAAYGNRYVRGDIAPRTMPPLMGDTPILHDNATMSGVDTIDSTGSQVALPAPFQVELERVTLSQGGQAMSQYTFTAGGQMAIAMPPLLFNPVIPSFDVGNTTSSVANPVVVRLYWMILCVNS